VYDQYDPNYDSAYPSATGATSLKDAQFYVLNSQFNVYKCLNNNNGGLSVNEPIGTDYDEATYDDGYIWKYMYTIPLSSRNKFLTVDYMPVQTSVTDVYYSNGQIGSVVVDNKGSGYLGNSAVSLNVNGSFIGASGNVVATLKPVLNQEGQFIDVIVSNPGANYKTASIGITDTESTGVSYYKGLSNVRIYNTGAAYFTNVVSNTSVAIVTTGAVQPTSNATANLVFRNNTLVEVLLTNAGTGYTAPAIANTTITIATTGSRQPTTNASANLVYTSGAVLVPKIVDGKIDSVVIVDPGAGYSSNLQTSLSLIGDGTGAVLTPYINQAGELDDIIIENRGEGYTYLNIQVEGNGTGANAYADLFVGDLNSVQSVVELSALDGAIYGFRINDPGSDYTTANIIVTGDGSDFNANVIVTNNTISYIDIINPGYGYTYANVTIGDNGLGGANANVSAIYSPVYGHGSNAVRELLADTIMFYSTINNEKNQGININNDFRQFGIIKNIKTPTRKAFSNTLGSACFLVTLDTVSGLSRDGKLAITKNGSEREFEIVEVVSATKQVLLTSLNNYTIAYYDMLTNPATGFDYTVTSIDKTPDINKFSGEILFIDNRTSVSYSEQQLVTLRTIVKL
jgi:hypothetical protein